jgi:hypothetical protein
MGLDLTSNIALDNVTVFNIWRGHQSWNFFQFAFLEAHGLLEFPFPVSIFLFDYLLKYPVGYTQLQLLRMFVISAQHARSRAVRYAIVEYKYFVHLRYLVTHHNLHRYRCRCFVPTQVYPMCNDDTALRSQQRGDVATWQCGEHSRMCRQASETL